MNTSVPNNEIDTKNPPSYLGIVLGLLIIALIFILGGLYMWGELLEKNAQQPAPTTSLRPTASENNEPESTTAEAKVETLGAISTSNELDAITADLESTLIEELDVDISAVEVEFESN